jgi:hypothetical protein
MLALLARATATTTATLRSPASCRASAFLEILKGIVILCEAGDLLFGFKIRQSNSASATLIS